MVQIMAKRMAKFAKKKIMWLEFRKSKSRLGIITSKIKEVWIFKQNEQLWVFRLKFVNTAQSRAIFCFF